MKKFLFLSIFVIIFCPIFVSAEQIDINSANLSQLDEIVHVGPKTAQKIIDSRPYSSVQDLSRVKGIGDGTYLQDIINQGFACVNCSPSPEATAEQSQTPAPTPALIPTPTPVPVTTPTPAPAITYPGGVYINEILPNPAGADSEDEWIELYNSNNSDVDLSGWQIQDTMGTTTIYTIPQKIPLGAQAKILANNFLVFKRPDTKIMLNNDQDGLILSTPDKKNADSVSFVSAPLGQSYNKTDSGWQWSLTLTPGAANIITTTQTPTISASPKALQTGLPKTKNSVKNDVKDTALADISLPAQAGQSIDSSQDNKTTNPWFLFFTTLAITIILAVIVLLIKLRFAGVTKP